MSDAGPGAVGARVRRVLGAEPGALPFLERLSPEEAQALYEHLARFAIRVAAGQRA